MWIVMRCEVVPVGVMFPLVSGIWLHAQPGPLAEKEVRLEDSFWRLSFSGGKWFDVSLLVWALFSLVSFGLGCCQKAGPTHARPGEMLQIYSAHYLSASIRFFFVTPKLVQETIRLVCNTEVFGSTPFMRHYSITIIFKHLRNSYKIAAAFTLFESSLSQSIKPRLRNHNNFGGVLASSSASTTARSRSKQKQSIDQSSVRCRRTSVPVTLPPSLIWCISETSSSAGACQLPSGLAPSKGALGGGPWARADGEIRRGSGGGNDADVDARQPPPRGHHPSHQARTYPASPFFSSSSSAHWRQRRPG
jgi:hypothetical protein